MKIVNTLYNTTSTKLNNFLKSICNRVTFIALNMTTLFMMTTIPTAAEGSNTESIDGFITFACDWLFKIGGTVALIGGVMFALSWNREDAEGKSKALLTLMAGFMLVAISQSPGLFGL